MEEEKPAVSHAAPRHVWVLLGVMVFLWAVNFVVAKIALREFPPLLAGALRFSIAGAVIAPFWWFNHRGQPAGRFTGRAFLRLLALGVVGVGLNQLCFLTGMQLTSVGHASFVIALTPAVVMLMASAAGQEPLVPRKLIGIAVAIGGVALLQAAPSKTGGGNLLGDVFIFLAGFTFAVFTVFGKAERARFDGLTINMFAYGGSSVVLLPATIWLSAGFAFGQVTWAGWASLLYMALFPSLLCYMIFFHALRYIPATRISVTGYIQPLLATLLGVTLLGEPLTAALAAGGAVVLAGVFLTERA
jgi:drug/metabolite transporter (DMT)-like permease